MDINQNKRRQSLKVIISEAVMVITVIVMVVALAFIVSGYWFNSDFEIERQGLLQVSSTPTGADIEIDGSSSWLQKTNTSKVLSSGEHEVNISKPGYDSWSKNITISEGLLYRLDYPRLFLLDRKSEVVFETLDTVFTSVSPKHETMLLANGTTEWQIINLSNDTPEVKKIDISAYFSATSIATGASKGLFAGEIISCKWDHDGTHALLKINSNNAIEWVLLDIKNLANSINITKTFGYNFDRVRIISNSSHLLLATQNGNLHRIDLGNRSISSVLATNVTDFDHYDNEVILSAKDDTTGSNYVGLLNLNSGKITTIKATETVAKVAISKFYDQQYLVTLENNQAALYNKEDLSELKTFSMSFTPDSIIFSHGGEFVVFSANANLASVDMEPLSLVEWQVEGPSAKWLDGYMLYTISDGKLIVYDPDGLNRRELSHNVSSNLTVTITDNKWLYYFSDDRLMRESLIPS